MELRRLHAADAVAMVPAGAVLVPAAPLVEQQAPDAVAASAGATQQAGPELVFIDARVDDLASLVQDIEQQRKQGRDIQAVVVAGNQDGIALIGQTLDAAGQAVGAIHLIGHGDAASLTLGSTQIDQTSLRQRAGEFASWALHLTGQADLLIYGCDFAAGSNGQWAVNALARLTGADVAASDNLTGAASLGGDWLLEQRSGTIEASLALSPQEQATYDSVLVTYTVTNTNASGAGSLAQAVIDANASGGLDTINFNIGGGGHQVINATGALNITDPVIIDGTSQPGFAGTPLIELNGTAVPADHGIILAAGSAGSTIAGLVINRFGLDGIHVVSTNNTITGNYIGTDYLGTTALGNGNDGIEIVSSDNTIDGRNVISGNGANGILISGASSNQVSGNYVGIDATGNAALGNAAFGIRVGASSFIQIGGNLAADVNVVSGNGLNGISLFSNSTTVVLHNIVGLNAAGDTAIANGQSGITVGGGNGDVILSNVVSGNTNQGIYVDASSNTKIVGNLIGRDAANTVNIGNQSAGVLITNGSSGTMVGSVNSQDSNVIAGNGSAGVAVANGSGSSQTNSILGNQIRDNGGLGIDLAWNGVTTNDALDADAGPNGLQNFPVLVQARTDGRITGSFNAKANTTYRIEYFGNPVGDADPTGHGEGAVYLGFQVVTTDGAGNASLLATSGPLTLSAPVSAKATEVINLALDQYGATSEFAANALVVQGPGVTVTPLTALTTTEAGGTAQFSVVLDTAPVSNVTIGLTLSNISEGLLSTSLLTFTPANWNIAQVVTVAGVDDTVVDGNVLYTALIAPAVSGDADYSGLDPADVMLTNTDNDTANRFQVTNTSDLANGNTTSILALQANDGGDGISLREAMLAANNTANGAGGPDRINFNIAAPLVGGAHTINLASALPLITDAVIIDGSSEPDYAATGNQPVVVLAGSGAGTGANGLEFSGTADASQVIGLVINGFDGAGIVVNTGANSLLIVGNRIGTDVSGMSAVGNNQAGILLAGGQAQVRNNLISGNLVSDLHLAGAQSSFIVGNTIGLNVAGTASLVQNLVGVLIDTGATNNLVGWTGASDGNTIGGYNGANQSASAVVIQGATTTGNQLYGNRIGLAGDVGNHHGIVVTNAAKNTTIGAIGAGNLIANTTYEAIWISGSGTNTVDIVANLIGTDTLGRVVGSGSGIMVAGGASFVTIGAAGAGAGNTIANTVDAGVWTNGASGVKLTGNLIYNTGKLAIDLQGDGVTANDAGDVDSGDNGLQNFPVLTQAAIVGPQVSIAGSLNSQPNTGYRIEFFAAAGTSGVGTAQAQRYLGFVDVTTDGSGNAAISTTLTAAVSAGERVTATATTLAGPVTSELAAGVIAATSGNPPVITLPAAPSPGEDVDTAVTGLSVNDVDNDLSQVSLQVQHGVLTVDLSGGAWITAGASGASALSLTGTLAAINAALDSLHYQGDANYFGADQLDVGAVDTQGLTDVQSLPFTVAGRNDAPQLTLPGLQTIAEDAPLVFSLANGNSITLGDVDAGAGALRLTLGTNNGRMTLGSTAGLTFLAGTGSNDASIVATGTLAALNAALQGMTYSPDANYNGSTTIAMVLNDQGNSGAGGSLATSGSVNIDVTAVNDAPFIIVPGAQATAEGTPLVLSVANGNVISIGDVDLVSGVDALQVTLTVSNAALTLATLGGLTFSTGTGSNDATMTFTGTRADINSALNALSMQPGANFNGIASLSVSVDDLGNTGSGGPLTASGLVNVTVNAVNDPPSWQLPAAQSRNEDTSLVFSSAGGNAMRLQDPDAGPGNLQVTLSTAAGQLTLAGLAGLTLAQGTGSGDRTMTFSGTLAAINAALDGLRLDPDANFAGLTAIDLSASDLGNTGAGGPQTAPASLPVTILPVNDAPTAQIGAAQYAATEGLSLMLSGTGLSVADLDAAGGQLTATLAVGEGQLTAQAGTTGVVITGNASGSLTLTGTLAQINALLAGLAGSSLGFVDPLDQPAASTRLTLTVDDLGNTGAGGAHAGLASVNLLIAAVNDLPSILAPATVAGSEDTELVFSVAHGNVIVLADADAQGNALQLSLSVGSGVLTLAGTQGISLVGGANGSAAMVITGSLAALNAALEGARYTPVPDANGVVMLSLALTDLGASGQGGAQTTGATVLLNLAPVNDAPRVITVDANAGLLEGAPAGTPAGRVSAFDPDDVDGLVFSLSDSAGGRFAIDPVTGVLSVAAASVHASDPAGLSIVVRVTDPQGAFLDQRVGIQPKLVVTPEPASAGRLPGTAPTPMPPVDPAGARESIAEQIEQTRRQEGWLAVDTGATRPRPDRRPPTFEVSRLPVIGHPPPAGMADVETSSRRDDLAGWTGDYRDRGLPTLRADWHLSPARVAGSPADHAALSPSDRLQPDFGAGLQQPDGSGVGPIVPTVALRAGTAVLTAGTVIWLLRSVGLLSAMLTSLPAWRGLDPLVLLAPRGDRKVVFDVLQNTEAHDEEAGAKAIFTRMRQTRFASTSPSTVAENWQARR